MSSGGLQGVADFSFRLGPSSRQWDGSFNVMEEPPENTAVKGKILRRQLTAKTLYHKD